MASACRPAAWMAWRNRQRYLAKVHRTTHCDLLVQKEFLKVINLM
jgi:hypothetical protein